MQLHRHVAVKVYVRVNTKHAYVQNVLRVLTVSYTHLTLPTNREV